MVRQDQRVCSLFLSSLLGPRYRETHSVGSLFQNLTALSGILQIFLICLTDFDRTLYYENVENIQVNSHLEKELLNYSHTLQCSNYDFKLSY